MWVEADLPDCRVCVLQAVFRGRTKSESSCGHSRDGQTTADGTERSYVEAKDFGKADAGNGEGQPAGLI